MTTRRTLFVAAPAVVASLASVKSVLAQGAQEPAKQADFLFVQTAKRMTFDKSASKLTLTGVSPIMVMFSDRPERIAANMRTAAIVPFWSKGLPLRPAQCRHFHSGGRPAPADRRRIARPGAAGRQPDLHGQSGAGRYAGRRIRCVGLYRYHGHAFDAAVVRGGCPAQLSARVFLSVTFRRSSRQPGSD